MKILQERGLFGAGLVPVTTPLLVDRYNECLKAIGKEPTEKKRFAIDGAGWSPQIAAERKDPNYLCHGEANLYAVILTPDQQGKPVYMPMHSFDWKILESIHSAHRKSIHNLTGMSGIVLDIDQGIDAYHSPFDLLMMHSIVVRSSTPDRIMTRARDQRLLVARFRHEPDAYANRALIDKLLDSARRHGDLRHRALTIPEVQFSEVQNFHTRAMGGVFVFRDCPEREEPLIVTERGDLVDDVAGHHTVYPLHSQPDYVLKLMEEAGLVIRMLRLPEEERKVRLLELVEYLQVRAIYDSGCTEDLSQLTAAQQKGYRVAAEPFLPESYRPLRDCLRAVSADVKPPRIWGMSPAWKHSLIPNPQLDPLTTDIVWQVLCLVDPVNIEMTFRHSKRQFYRLYQDWNPGRRRWAIHILESKGLSRPE